MKIIITAGGTTESIDQVRSIVNKSTGKLGSLIAEEFSKENVDIVYLCSANSIRPNIKNIKIIETITDLENAITSLLQKGDIDAFVHAMAVSDYSVEGIETGAGILKPTAKISSENETLKLVLKKNKKIIKMIKELSPKTMLIGFKLLVDVSEKELLDVGYETLQKNKCTYVLANDLTDITDKNHKAILIDTGKNFVRLETKNEIAKTIVHEVMK